MTPYSIFLVIIAFAAGAIAAVTGFGIGSILTPLLGFEIGVKLAVAAVSIPHVIGTAIRFWTLRDRIDKQVLKTFGVMSAAGSFAGALMHTMASAPALKIAFGLLLVVAGLAGVTGHSEQLRFGRVGAWIAGGISGFLGGLIGNQGGIRAAAMLAFDVRKEAFVATAVTIGLIVDGVRMPVYAYHEGRALLAVWPVVVVTAVAVSIGTLLGRPLLGRLPERVFRRAVSALIMVLGVTMLMTR